MLLSRLFAFGLALCLCACAHEAENTGVENSSVMIFPATYAFELTDTDGQGAATPEFDMFPEQDVTQQETIFPAREDIASAQPLPQDDNVIQKGNVSRFQRNIIVAGGPANPNASAQSQYFDDVMDHLETLMAPQIAENNRIAMMQEKIPGYKF